MNNLAHEYWTDNKPLEAGKLIFESLPIRDRPGWASRILRFVIDRTKIQNPTLDRAIAVAENERLWSTAHEVFDKIRAEILALDELAINQQLPDDREQLALVLTVGELVAKVTYNSTEPTDEFDEDSGWWIASCLKEIIDHDRHDARLAQNAWVILSNATSSCT